MVDYNKATGSTGTMRIRVGESTVAFMINSGNSTTFTNSLEWGYTVNGTTNNTRVSAYAAGSGWLTLATFPVTTDQTVTFRLFDTGTSGLGGPTTLSVAVDRATVPNPPSQPNLTNVTSTSVNVTFTDNWNGGSPITLRQIGRTHINSTASGVVTTNSDGSTVVSGLTPGVTYYFWARVQNAKGWSAWSNPRQTTTLKLADQPDPVIVSDATQTSVVASFTDNGTGGTAILERQIAYNTANTTTGASSVAYTGVMTITGLLPATTYYFWARVRNSVGWGPYSPVAINRTIAGAYFKDGDTWKEAVPYVRDGGMWKLARPWVRSAGTWKETM